MSAIFEPYFTLAEIGARLPFSRETLLAMMKRGEFSPKGPDDKPDLSNILFDPAARCFLVPLSGLEHYRVTNALSCEGLVTRVVTARLRAEPPERPVFEEPRLVARSPGEARRKFVQTSAQNGEVAHG